MIATYICEQIFGGIAIGVISGVYIFLPAAQEAGVALRTKQPQPQPSQLPKKS